MKGNTKGSLPGLIAVVAAAVCAIAAFILGQTVNPTYWNTANVLTSGADWFMFSGIAAIAAAVIYVALFKFFPNGIVLHIVTLAIAMCSVSALAAMWSNCVVEIAYIYGEGNLELGNTAAVAGSQLLFVATGLYVAGALAVVVANAIGLTKTEKQ